MPFEIAGAGSKRVAVIGGGISGLGAAYQLRGHHSVVLFEAEGRLGGHARTVMAGKNGDLPVDTGFLVFNHVNYPKMTKLFDDLGVPTIHSDMSFGVSIDGGWLEYGLMGASRILAQKRNVFRPKFLKMMRDILRFNNTAEQVAKGSDMTIGQLIDHMNLGDWFRDYYLTPFTGAIWSTPVDKILDFPAHAMIEFMKNHAILNASGQHQWWTVKGGSREYVTRLAAALETAGVEIRTGTPVDAVRRIPGGVEIQTKAGDWEVFDEVIFASHSDQTLAMLKDASPRERASLSKVKYQPNDMVLHGDTRMMPNRRAAWASWIYSEDQDKTSDRIDLTYWINNLQSLPDDDPCFVTLNSQRDIDPAKIYDQCTFHHPVFDHGALEAQQEIAAWNGTNNTWFCGAWMRNGFHEDGLATGMEAADALIARSTAMAVAAE